MMSIREFRALIRRIRSPQEARQLQLQLDDAKQANRAARDRFESAVRNVAGDM